MQTTLVGNNKYNLCPWENLKFSRKNHRKTQIIIIQGNKEMIQEGQ